jgi:AcrR family transcriptional regulator
MTQLIKFTALLELNFAQLSDGSGPKVVNPVKTRSRAAQMQPEERRHQLLRAGVASFAAKGIGGTKHADLARACQVSVPAVFSYFPNRDALVSAVLENAGNALIENVLTPALSLPRPEQLPATAPLFVEFAARDPDYVKVWLMWSMHFAPEIQAQFQIFENRAIETLAEMFVDEVPSKNPHDDLHDRARMLLASSAFLAKMVFDGVSEKRRQDFVGHVLKSLAIKTTLTRRTTS